MNVVVPYTRLHPTVRQVLVNCYGLAPRFVHVPHDHGYWKLFCELWRDGKTVVLIEHDVLPWPGAIEELLACPGLWCSCTYKMTLNSQHSTLNSSGYGIHHAFGCTKISADFMRLLPDVWQRVANREWHTLDAQLFLEALHIGQLPHPHRPPVIHLK